MNTMFPSDSSITGVVVPSNPADLKKIKDTLILISNEMTMIESRRALISDEIKNMAETYDLPAKYCRKMAATYHKQTFKQEVQELDEFEVLYEAVVGTSS